ncbi:MAG: hypothetical protein ACREJ4_12825 [Candidatus Methylomirabilaceae bacterium]
MKSSRRLGFDPALYRAVLQAGLEALTTHTRRSHRGCGTPIRQIEGEGLGDEAEFRGRRAGSG